MARMNFDLFGGLRHWLRRPATAPAPAMRVPPRFALYRILGNDLPPRHAAGQTIGNVRFILENEPAFPNCTKHWVLNRITDRQVEAALAELLEAHSQPFDRIPFDAGEYAAREWDVAAFNEEDWFAALGEPDNATGERNHRIEYRIRLAKNRYVMNNNGARNFAIESGAHHADYILPLDGSIFLTAEAFAELAASVLVEPAPRYLVIPMARTGSDAHALLREGISREARDEPQIGFHRDAEARFDEALGYGYRPKVELLGRLHVLGGGYTFATDRWDVPLPPPPSDRERHTVAGRVARLPSGSAEQEVGTTAVDARFMARSYAIIEKLDGLDRAAIAARLETAPLMLIDRHAIEAVRGASPDANAAAIRRAIVEAAEHAIARGPLSILVKSEVGGSGDKQDVLCRAPYWWPDPDMPDGRPFIRRDGERVPEADPARPESAAFDAARLEQALSGAITCALTRDITGETRFGVFGADLVRNWFLSSESAMNPNFAFAQIRPGHAGERGQGTGLVEIRHLAAFLDAVRLLGRAGHLAPEEIEALRAWCASFAGWLRASAEGRAARVARNNIGTYHDLVMLALSAFTRDAGEIVATLRRMRVRMKFQFDPEGGQGDEATRTLPLHYQSFNLFGWAELATMSSRIGVDVPAWGGGILAVAAGRLLARGRDAFDAEGIAESWVALQTVRDRLDRNLPAGEVAALPVDAYGPFWQLHDARGLGQRDTASTPAPPSSPGLRDAPAA